jgi:hypothetical protein
MLDEELKTMSPGKYPLASKALDIDDLKLGFKKDGDVIASESMNALSLNDAQPVEIPQKSGATITVSGSSTQGIDIPPSFKDEVSMTPGSLSRMGTSPPAVFSWSWGGFPEKQDQQWEKGSHAGTERERALSASPTHRLNHHASTPFLKGAYRGEPMSTAEKVDQYLAGLPETHKHVIPLSPDFKPVKFNAEMTASSQFPIEISLWFIHLIKWSDEGVCLLVT